MIKAVACSTCMFLNFAGIGIEEAVTEIAQEVHTLHKMKRSSCGEVQGDISATHRGFYRTTSDQHYSRECAC